MDFDFQQIDDIINARSLAIVGASNSPSKFGHLFTSSQLDMDFTGSTYLVNAREKEIMGRKAYPDLLSLPESPDLVFLTIPAHRSIDVLEDCARIKTKCVMMIASGFREIGEQGKELERKALEMARAGGFRILGPNCFGIYNPRTHLTMLPGYDFSTVPGNVAFISQSGGFSAHVARQGNSLGIGFSAVVSYGNAADLDETDFIRYFTLDPHTEVIAGYIEGASDGERFARALKEAASTKPVVLWKIGKGETARRAAVSHTGALAGSAEIWDALMKQCGVITASGVDEVTDVLLALEHLGRKPGKKLLISGGGGGLGTYGADIAESEGLSIPPINGSVLERLQEILNSAGAVAGNPLDIGAPVIHLPVFAAAMSEAAANPTTDILVFDLAVNFAEHLVGEERLFEVVDVFVEARRATGKGVVLVLYSRSCDADNVTFESLRRRMRDRLHEAGIPVYPSMSRAIRAIAKANE